MFSCSEEDKCLWTNESEIDCREEEEDEYTPPKGSYAKTCLLSDFDSLHEFGLVEIFLRVDIEPSPSELQCFFKNTSGEYPAGRSILNQDDTPDFSINMNCSPEWTGENDEKILTNYLGENRALIKILDKNEEILFEKKIACESFDGR